MRKVLIFALTVAIALGGIGFAHAAVTENQEQVAIYPTHELGDRAVLDGMTAAITFQSHDGFLRWHTDHTFGGETQTEFVYDFNVQASEYDTRKNNMDLWIAPGSGMRVASGAIDLHYVDHGDLYRAVAEQTPNGERRTMCLPLEGNMTHYSVAASIYYQDKQFWCDNSDPSRFTSRFRFPIQPGRTVSVTVEKDANGRICALEHTIEDVPHLKFASGMNGEGLWFIPIFQDADGTPLEYESPYGHGIYFVPWKTIGEVHVSLEELTHVVPDMAELKRIMPLDQTDSILDAEFDLDADRALMLIREEERLFLTVLDLAAGEVVKKVDLPSAADNGWLLRDNGYILVVNPDRVALVEENTWKLLLTAPDVRGERYAAYCYDPELGSLHYDGSCLCLIQPIDYYREHDFWTIAFRQGEAAYYGEYGSSLGAAGNLVTAGEHPITWKMP